MASEAGAGAGTRTPLSRDRVLSAAVDLADEAGIGSLTMRKLGDVLGVKAMSLYNHVANKEDILDGMVDVVFSEIDLPPGDSDWKLALRRRALSAREAFSRHPWASGLMQSRTKMGPATLRHHDAVIGLLREAGFSIEMTANAYTALDSYIYGYALQETSSPHANWEEVTEVAEVILRQLPTADYPYLAEMITETVKAPDHERVDQWGDLAGQRSDEFEFGLDLILDGLERLRDTG